MANYPASFRKSILSFQILFPPLPSLVVLVTLQLDCDPMVGKREVSSANALLTFEHAVLRDRFRQLSISYDSQETNF